MLHLCVCVRESILVIAFHLKQKGIQSIQAKYDRKIVD